MTEQELRAKVVGIAQSYIGCKESNGSHKKIIDLYNGHKPLARGYKVKYTDAWCSTFASAVAIAAGLTDIIPTECGCEKHIQLFKALGSWQENDAHVPSPGDYIFYDWDDKGAGDCTGAADHVGIVEKVSGGSITVIEGNMSNAVGRRTLKVNGRYIRGYGVPKYSAKAKGTGTTAGAATGYTVGKTNEETIYNFCREVLGLNAAGAVGVISNIGPESNFETGAIGDGGTSFGICQWHAGRYASLKTWCSGSGKDYTTLDGQLWYMKYELEKSYSSVLSYLKSVPDTADGAYNAAYRWCLKFEVPANKEAASERRGNIARTTYWPKYGKASTGTTAPSTGLSVGDVVSFTGTKHYTSSNATSGSPCKPGRAKVTAIAKGTKHPYHLVKESRGGSTVYGWVDAADIDGTAQGAARTYTVRSGDSLWVIAAKQLGSGTRYTEIKALNGLKSDTIHPGQVLKLPE